MRENHVNRCRCNFVRNGLKGSQVMRQRKLMRLLLAVPVLAIPLLGAAYAVSPEENDRLCSGDDAETAVSACSAIVQSDQLEVEDVANALNRRGHAYFNLGQTERAIQDFDEAIKLDPNSVQGFYNRAIAYFRIHQTDRAVRDFDQAIKLDPNNTYALTNRGVVYAAAGQYARALQDFDRAIGLDPNNANAFYDRGLVKQKSGDAAGGDADIAHARQLQSDVGR
jgi:tetratricopeptide (TPR) repeat protein